VVYRHFKEAIMRRVRLSVLTITVALAVVVTGLAVAQAAQPAPTRAPAAGAADPTAKRLAAVTDALKARYPKAAITKAETTTSGEKVSNELVPAAKESKDGKGDKDRTERALRRLVALRRPS
jgi:hypothetical protein